METTQMVLVLPTRLSKCQNAYRMLHRMPTKMPPTIDFNYVKILDSKEKTHAYKKTEKSVTFVWSIFVDLKTTIFQKVMIRKISTGQKNS
jgi:hypothetical protein